MKKVFILKTFPVLAVVLFFITINGCDRAQDVILAEQMRGPEPMQLHISIVYPFACLGDQSYCDLLSDGIKKAEAELNIDIDEIESSPETWDSDLREASKKSDLILTAGYQMSEPIQRVAPDFPDVGFAIIDSEVDLPNVASFIYNVNEGSFLVGAIAALKTETEKVGYIGGADVPLLHEFEAGYTAGVHAVNPGVEVFREYVAAGPEGFDQPMVAEDIATRQYERGVDIIYAVAAGSGHGVVEAAMTLQKYVIWVDTNINATAPDIFLTSMLRQINNAVYNIVTQFAAGSFTPGVHRLGLKADDIVYVLDEHNRPHLSDEILMAVEALKAQIVSGEIVVPVEPILPR